MDRRDVAETLARAGAAPEDTLTSWEPSWRDRLRQVASSLLGAQVGEGAFGKGLINDNTGLVDFTPAAGVLAANQEVMDKSQYGLDAPMSLDNAMSMVPGGKALGQAVRGARPAVAKVAEALQPRTFFRGTNPGDERRISTGAADWDSHLFASSDKDSASMYGSLIEELAASPEAKILYQGTPDWTKVAGKQRKGENLLQYAERAAAAARAAGYDAAHFERQGDVGTAIFNRDRFPVVNQANPILSSAEGSPRVSTRFPTGAKATEDPITSQLSIGMTESLQGPSGAHNASLLADAPGYRHLQGGTPEEIARGYTERSADNLRFLIDRMPKKAVKETQQWYEGAQRISDSLAERYGLPRPSTSAALASLSPQKDWFQNASLGERTVDTVMRRGDKPPTPEMMAFMSQHPVYNKNPIYIEAYRSMEGKPLAQLDPLQKAMSVRAYDEAHNPRNYRTIMPTGNYGDMVRNASGSPAKVAWGSFPEVSKAIQAIESGGDPRVLSPLLGEKHKVRSFYNNIEDPYEAAGAFGDVTADTHAVAANQLRPLSGNTDAVAQNFGNNLDKSFQSPVYRNAKGSSVTGVQGTYGFNSEPYRIIAPDYGLRPRAAQSVGWEAIRDLFPDTFKTKFNSAMIDEIWGRVDKGEISADRARQAIFKAAGGFKGKGWEGSGAGSLDPRRASTFR